MDQNLYLCPVCNGFSSLQQNCSTCQRPLIDLGRLMDQYGDYSPYRPIDALKLTDGIPSDYKDHQCPHLLYCSNCQRSEQVLFPEQPI